MIQRIDLKMYPNLCANTYHDVTNFELDGMALDIKI